MENFFAKTKDREPVVLLIRSLKNKYVSLVEKTCIIVNQV